MGKITEWGLDQVLENYVNKEIATVHVTGKFDLSVFVRNKLEKGKKGE